MSQAVSAGVALRRRRLRRLVEPGVEGGRSARVAVAEMAQVVEAHAGADDRDAFVAQRLERLAELDVERRIEVLAQGQHDHRDLGLRIDDQERHEHAVIEAAGVVGRDRQARLLDQPLDLAAISGAPGAG